MRLRSNEHSDHGLLAGLHHCRDVKVAADECALDGANLRSVYPDRGRIVDAIEIEPDMAALVLARNFNDGAIPVRRMHQRLGNDFGPVVLAVKRLWVDFVIHQRGEHCSRHRCRVPTARFVSGGGNLRAGLGHFGHILKLPTRVEHHRFRNRAGGSVNLSCEGEKRQGYSNKSKKTAFNRLQNDSPGLSLETLHS